MGEEGNPKRHSAEEGGWNSMAFESIRPDDAVRYAERQGCLLIDLRPQEDYCAGHIPGAIPIPYDELDAHKKKLKPYLLVLYCDRGNTSLLAARDLDKEGYRIVNVYGGIHMFRGRLEKGGAKCPQRFS